MASGEVLLPLISAGTRCIHTITQLTHALKSKAVVCVLVHKYTTHHFRSVTEIVKHSGAMYAVGNLMLIPHTNRCFKESRTVSSCLTKLVLSWAVNFFPNWGSCLARCHARQLVSSFFCYDNAPGVPDTCQYQAISYWLFTLFCTFAPLLAR